MVLQLTHCSCSSYVKFPLVSWSGKIRKMVADARNSNLSRLELVNLPGGSKTFELAAKFCYGANLEINATNVAQLRCAAEYLEMTEDYWEENLIEQTETYLNEVVLKSLEKSVQVLSSCEALSPMAETVGIIARCVDAIAINARKEQLVSGLGRLDCDGRLGKSKTNILEWWVEDLSELNIDFYQRVISALRRTGVQSESIITSLMHYAQTSLKDIEKRLDWDPEKLKLILQILLSLLPTEKNTSVPFTFLFGMLRTAIIVDATGVCRLELERRIGFRLESVSLDDLLIPSSHSGDSFFDVDTVHRVLVNFLQRIKEEGPEDLSQNSFESNGLGSPTHGSMLKVGRLIDSYLAEIAPDPYLDLRKFIAIIEILPDYARIIDDGLYRAVDIYLKAHPALTEFECKKLCKFIDCQKLSQEACHHAAQNDRLPVQMALRILYFEQIRLKSYISESSGDGFLSQRVCSGVPSAAVSPRDNYASLRRENRELKLEISRMRVRLSELEKEQVLMKQGIMERSGNGKKFLTSISKGIGWTRIFGGATEGKGQKPRKKSQGLERKTRRHSNSLF
ncbi:hypothetical protein GIB67_041056 [Kingdonia uniflora]|uniref:NPH3 domain-containing protein n=1 Tax=Kingdonia uniflora TaxID=39325 RepID=A0A7J7LKD7_9MAGN|nr:hypothetical protein GIB67_041056 [Kingdonia uniflora]